jgi:hypothetical protein
MVRKKASTKKEPLCLSEEYHNARRQLVLWSGILFAWELIGINLENITGEIGAFAKSIRSPEAIPWVLLILVGYFFYRLMIEWLQCEPQRRARRVSKVDFATSLGIAIIAFLLFSVQRLFVDFRVADKIASLELIEVFSIAFGVTSFFFMRLIYGMLRHHHKLFEKKPGIKPASSYRSFIRWFFIFGTSFQVFIFFITGASLVDFMLGFASATILFFLKPVFLFLIRKLLLIVGQA